MGAVIGAAIATAIVELVVFDPLVADVLLFQLGGGILGFLLGRLGPVERLLAGRRHQEEAVNARAEQAFFEHGLHQTRDGTGVLVFASLLEHRAVIIGDRGIHARIGDEGWRQAVDALVAGMRRGAPGEGFEAAIDLVGGKLAEHFPRADGAPPANELPDALKRDR
jgi:putative membrane protein